LIHNKETTMEGYSQTEFHEFVDEEDEEEEVNIKKSKVKYSTILKEEDFINEEE
jgi:hypothetical protein